MKAINCILCNRADTEILYGRGIFKRGEGLRKFTNVICKNCGLVYINPQMGMDDIADFADTKYIESRFALNGDERIESYIKHLEGKQGQKNNLEYLKKFIKPENRVLEIGSGFGLLLKAIKDTVNCHIQGIEPAESAKYAASKYHLPIFHGTFDKFCEDNKAVEKFDIILMHHVFEHFPDPLLVLQKIRQLLKPSGLLYIEVPNILSFERETKYFFDFWHYFNYSPGTLRKVLRKGGFFISDRNQNKPSRIQIVASLLPGGAMAEELWCENSYKEIRRYIKKRIIVDPFLKTYLKIKRCVHA